MRSSWVRSRLLRDTPSGRQALFAVPLLVNGLLIVASGQLEGLLGWYQTGFLLGVLATVAAVLVDRGALPRSLVWLVPVVDIVAVGLMRLLTESGGVGVLAVLPAMWLGFDHRVRGVVATALLMVLTVSLPTLAYFGFGAEPWARTLLLPMVAIAIATAGAVLRQVWTQQRHELAIKHEQLEQALEVAQQISAQQEAIAATIDVGLVTIDRTGAYTSLNHKQRELLDVGYPLGHRGRAGQEGLVFREDRLTPIPSSDMPTSRAMRGERFSDYLLWIGDPEERQLAISVSATPQFDLATGEFEGAVLVYKDVTDLVSALRVKDDFVATVSHELRTPLTSIMGFLDLVVETDPTLQESTRTQLSIVRRNAERLLRLVSDLLLAAQTDDGNLVLNLAHLDLSELVEHAVADVRPQAAEGEVELVVDLQPDVVLEVDETRLRQTVDNLLTNAVKYTRPGGRVTVTLAGEEGVVVLRVADTGIGIAAEDQLQVFSRFFRAADAETLAIQGAGLGLTITKAIVEAHGGTITVDSAPGEGTTFEVRLPRDVRTGPAGRYL